MKAIANKLRSQRGESLVEVLAAVLICTLSVLLLAYASMAAGNINQAASEQDETYYKALNAAEARDTVAGSTTLTVSASGTGAAGAGVVTVPVSLYGGEGVYSFAAVTPAPAPGGGGGP